MKFSFSLGKHPCYVSLAFWLSLDMQNLPSVTAKKLHIKKDRENKPKTMQHHSGGRQMPSYCHCSSQRRSLAHSVCVSQKASLWDGPKLCLTKEKLPLML